MSTFRTRSPFTINATQCKHATIIFTDCGQRKALPGDWIIEGKDRKHYVVDNTFFQMTFAPSTEALKAKDGNVAAKRIQSYQVAGSNSLRAVPNPPIEPKIASRISPISSASNVRAEDGFTESSPKGPFSEDILVPLGSLLAVFVTIACIVFASH